MKDQTAAGCANENGARYIESGARTQNVFGLHRQLIAAFICVPIGKSAASIVERNDAVRVFGVG
ncbi:hypothetical protein D3C87_1921200 [compost metagenome]